jgi:hypothetical protein
VLKIPSVMMGFGLPDDNLHAPNEKFHIPNFYHGIETICLFFEKLGAPSKTLSRFPETLTHSDSKVFAIRNEIKTKVLTIKRNSPRLCAIGFADFRKALQEARDDIASETVFALSALSHLHSDLSLCTIGRNLLRLQERQGHELRQLHRALAHHSARRQFGDGGGNGLCRGGHLQRVRNLSCVGDSYELHHVRKLSRRDGRDRWDGLSVTAIQGLINIVNQSYITVSGFEIRNYTTSKSTVTPAGIWVTGGGSGVQLLNNLVHNITTTSEKNGNAFGIAVYGTSSTPISNLVISGNQVYDLKTGQSESVNVDGNVIYFSITNNIVHDNDNIGIDAIGFEGVGPSGSDQARYGESQRQYGLQHQRNQECGRGRSVRRGRALLRRL